MPLKDFAKNSVRLVKRCTKPDRRGEDRGNDSYGLHCLARVRLWKYAAIRAGCLWRLRLNLPKNAVCCRVQQDLRPDGIGICRYGLHRLLRQAYLHSEPSYCCALAPLLLSHCLHSGGCCCIIACIVGDAAGAGLPVSAASGTLS